MDALFMIFVVGLALLTIVAMMYVVLREKHEEDAHVRYRRSPWDEPLAPAGQTDVEIEDDSVADAEIQAGTPAAHTPVTEEPAVEEPAVEEPAEEKKPE